MKTYPIMLDVRGRAAAVVGGGPVGLRKARSLRRAGAAVTLIAERLADPSDLDGITVVREPYRPGLLEGAMLVFACTDDREANARIAADARRIGALVNAADQPEECDFFLPAVVADGDVVVAVGTGGSAPALTKRLKARLAAALPQRIGEFAAVLGELRQELKASIPDVSRRGRIMKRLAGEEGYHAFLEGGAEAVRKLFEDARG